jgi:hypothetical protein
MSSSRLTKARACSRTHKWLNSTLLVLLGILFAILAVEVIARFVFRTLADERSYFQTIDRRILNSHPILDPKGNEKFGEILSRNAEHTYRTHEFDYTVHSNSLGFRTREIEPKQPKEWRVMMVGDSFFFGMVKDEDTISSQLERIAQETPGCSRSLKVYNFAIPGYTTVQELIVAKTYAPSLKPDQIILGFLAANDLIPNAVTYVDDKENLAVSDVQVKRIQQEIRSRIGWLRYSMIFRILSVSPYTTRLYYQIARQPHILEKNYAVLEQLKEYCERNQIRLTVVMMHCVDGVRGGWHGAWTQSRSVIRTLVDSCRSRGIDVIDMVDFIRGKQDVDALYYQDDGHPNVNGCRRIAEVIFDKAILDRLRTRGGRTAD